MIEDAMKLTVDLIFAPMKEVEVLEESVHVLDLPEENLWIRV
jgi:hypothetical protein